MRRRTIWICVLGLVALAAALRLACLELRPPHHDEGVNGWFVEQIVKAGYYQYDPTNYHGPSYFYLLAAAREALGFGLWPLRLPGALCGVLLCVVPLLLRHRLGWPRTLATCALLATSPTLVYYARYAIHETLLATVELITAACVLRWSDSGRARWLVAAGAGLAGMIATKETTILFVAVAGSWSIGETIVESWRADGVWVLGRRARWSRRAPLIALLVLGVMLAIHVVMFTGCLRAPGSISDALERSIDAYRVWARTGTGHSGHEKPWFYYLHLGIRYELVLYALASLGLVAGFRQRWIRGPGLVGFGMLGAYSLVAYKMPWLPLSWLVLLAIPAAHGAIALGRLVAGAVSRRFGTTAALMLALLPALAITIRSSFVRPADPREDLAYVATHPDYHLCMALVEAGAHRVGREWLSIAVEHDVRWPLAWALQPYPRRHWSVEGGEHILIVAADAAGRIEPRFHTTYLRRLIQLRDGAEPALLYLKRSMFAPLVAASGEYELVGPATATDLARM